MAWGACLWHRYDRTIWIRVVGTILTKFSEFMIRPFLAIYLYNRLDDNLLLTALVVGLQPAAGMIAGLFAGGLSDRYGRKPLMVIALFLQSLSVLGYIWADVLWHYALLTLLSGLCNSLFWPAASAQVTDVVPQEKRSEVFALLHTALNLGAAAGPLIGVALYRINPQIVFAICSAALFAYGLLIAWLVPETMPKAARTPIGKSGNSAARTPGAAAAATDGSVDGSAQAQPKLRLGEHTTLLWITLAGIAVSLLYSQVEVILPQQLKTHFSDYMTTFATLMTINGTMVVCCQMVIVRFADRFPPQRVILAAYLLLACVGFGYGWSDSFMLLVATEVLFTLGEMMYGPQIQKAISLIAPPDFRGRYFSVFGANWGISGTIGPTLGAFAFGTLGGAVWFSLIGLLLIVAGLFQYRLVAGALRRSQTQQTSTEGSEAAVIG